MQCDCGLGLIEPNGDPAAPYLVIGEFPGTEEIRTGIAWVGQAGRVLREEMQRVGLPNFRSTNIWLHEPTEDECLEIHLRILGMETANRKGILIVGSDATKVLYGVMVSKVSGLWVEGAPIPIVFGYNPAMVLRRGATYGEVQLYFDIFAKRVRGEL